MKVGDLVKYIGDDENEPPVLGYGIVMAFDDDDDPIISFIGDDEPFDAYEVGNPYHRFDIEVLNYT